MAIKVISILLVVILIAIYLVAMPLAKRKQMQRQKDNFDQFIASLKVGDQVVMQDGIMGELTQVNDEDVKIKIAANVIIHVKKMAIMAKQSEV
ncbi:preprotein translocase subunit YajC [Lactiplantibacillus carotarum]|uniref:preprotein translocase subunit YajC n=1 Tax=Lactiplantibacillus carotarum TaxID=2993456 RepID=UPI00298EEE0D|nr:preprotein translocase subunit YajC [Lactiplantibacillus carotarum]